MIEIQIKEAGLDVVLRLTLEEARSLKTVLNDLIKDQKSDIPFVPYTFTGTGIPGYTSDVVSNDT